MGQKVHPIGLRVGIIRDWDSKWYSEKEFATNLHEDFKIREFITKKLKDSSVSKVEIDRFDKKSKHLSSYCKTRNGNRKRWS